MRALLSILAVFRVVNPENSLGGHSRKQKIIKLARSVVEISLVMFLRVSRESLPPHRLHTPLRIRSSCNDLRTHRQFSSASIQFCLNELVIHSSPEEAFLPGNRSSTIEYHRTRADPAQPVARAAGNPSKFCSTDPVSDHLLTS